MNKETIYMPLFDLDKNKIGLVIVKFAGINY